MTSALVGDDGENNSEPDIVKITVGEANSIPLADAGADQYTTTGTAITLNGSNSHDADAETLTHRWFLTAKPQGSTLTTLTDETTANPTFTPDVIGTYMIGLIVNDGQIDSAIDSMLVIVTEGNNAPVANAGLEKTVEINSNVTLNGINSYDDDGDTLTYAWTLTSPIGSNASLDDSATKKPSFTADKVGDYQASLSVSDGNSDSEIDTVIITVIQPNRQPVADAGADQNKQVDDTVTLDGNSSSDEDGEELIFSWSLTARPGGSAASLTGADTEMPTFIADVAGTYTAQLIVKDGTVDSDADMVTIVVNVPDQPPVNNKPVAVITPLDGAKFVGQSVDLNGADSTDADGQDPTDIWELNKPETSQASLANTDAETTSFTPDVAGDYEVTLVVNDGDLSSEAVVVVVTVQELNIPPVAVITTTDDLKFVGQPIGLSGSNSSDDNGDDLTYQWSVVSSPADVSLSATDIKSVTFTPTVEGDYAFSLVVHDSNIASEPVNTTISVGTNTTPTVVITEPADVTVFNSDDTITFMGSCEDTEDGVLSDDKFVWSSNIDGEICDGQSTCSKTLKAGKHDITLTCTDSLGAPGKATIKITVEGENTPPFSVKITSPERNARFTTGESITFTGSAEDKEEGTLSSDALVWTSSIDGEIGKGGTVTKALSDGKHIITLEAKDSLDQKTNIKMSICVGELNCGFIFSDDFESGLDNWVTSWGLSETSAVSGTRSVGDSPEGNYPANTNASLTLKGSIDLSATSAPMLTYWQKIGVHKWDNGYLEISEDGGFNWKVLQTYTQTWRSTWEFVQVDLSEYKASPIKIRYRLRANGDTQTWGWDIDDVEIKEL